MQVGFKTDKGITRSNNEDACFVLLKDKVYILCDGVGGGNSGEIASRTAVREISKYVLDNPITRAESTEDIAEYILGCFERANEVIFRSAVIHPENRGMATTGIMLHVRNGKAYIGNVGDSRVYIYRSGVLKQLTEDHTYVNTLVKAGILTEEQAINDNRRNVITKAVGANLTVEPDIFQVELLKDDIFIMCSDGLYDEVMDDQMIEIIKQSETMTEVCGSLIRAANENGGRDNITIISLKVTEEDVDEH